MDMVLGDVLVDFRQALINNNLPVEIDEDTEGKFIKSKGHSFVEDPEIDDCIMTVKDGRTFNFETVEQAVDFVKYLSEE